MRFGYAILPLVLATAAGGARAADTSAITVSSVGDLASLFEGEFTTLPPQAVGAPRPANVLYNLSKRVDVPSLGSDVVYAEEHEKTPDGPMLWQRLYSFKVDTDQDVIVMTPYVFSNGEQLAGTYQDSTPLAKLQPAAVKQQPDGCVVLWHHTEAGFDGILKPGSCKQAPAVPAKKDTAAISVSKTEYIERIPENSTEPLVFRRLR